MDFKTIFGQQNIDECLKIMRTRAGADAFFNDLPQMKTNRHGFVSFLLALSEKVYTLPNDSLKLYILEKIGSLCEDQSILEFWGTFIKNIAECAISLNENYFAAKYLEKELESDDDNIYLQKILRVIDLYLNSPNIERVSTLLTKAHQKLFRGVTPKNLISQFDMTRGKYSLFKRQYGFATRSYYAVYQNENNNELGIHSLKLAAIASCLDIETKNRLLLRSITETDVSKTFPFYSFIDQMAHDLFIDLAARDSFIHHTKSLLCIDITDDLNRSSIQHNLLIAKNAFSSVRIERLAQLIGSTPSEVEIQTRQMILSKRMNALIDQPARMIQFIDKQPGTSILTFSNHVSRVCNTINNLL